MSDMDEQETLINESISQDNGEGNRLRKLKLFQGNISNENISFEGGKHNLSNNSSIMDSIIHQPKEFPRINPSGSITEGKREPIRASNLSTNIERMTMQSIIANQVGVVGKIPQILYQNKFIRAEVKPQVTSNNTTPRVKDDEDNTFQVSQFVTNRNEK